MTTYRLPDGIEVKPTNNGEVTGAGVWVEHPVYGSIAVERDKLTEVKAPLPPEPPNGTVLSNGADAFIRCDDENDPDVGAWYCTGDKQTWAWAEVAPTLDPGYKRYIPDPADDAFELPWRGDGDTVEVSDPAALDDTPIWVQIKPSWRTPLEARQKAALLLRAAREVEQR